MNTEIKFAGVLGWPINHSLSPRLHGFWLRKYNIGGNYVCLAVQQSDIKNLLKSLPNKNFIGFNITVPHKEFIINFLDEIDDQALRIGAVNSVIFRPNGSMFGWNTDTFGFIENIKTMVSDWQPSKGPAVVLGAGGAARAICVALMDSGVPEIRLINRTQSRAESLAHHIGGPITIIPWSKKTDALKEVALLVNTTTLGMSGKPELDIDLSNLPIEAVVNDIVYSPLMTSLLLEAKKQGNVVVDGLGMLLHQARPSFAAWFGKEPEVTDSLRSHVLNGME